MKKIRNLLLFSALLVLSQCGGGQPMHVDGGSETVNAEVTDTTLVVTVNAQSVELTLYAADTSYLPESGLYFDSAVIVNNQTVRFNLMSGVYNLFIADNISGRGVSFRNIIMQPGRNSGLIDSLRASGSVSGKVVYGGLKVKFTITLKGTPFSAVTDSAGFYTLKCVPEGDYTITANAGIGSSATKDSKGKTLSYSIHIDEGSSQVINIYPSN